MLRRNGPCVFNSLRSRRSDSDLVASTVEMSNHCAQPSRYVQGWNGRPHSITGPRRSCHIRSWRSIVGLFLLAWFLDPPHRRRMELRLSYPNNTFDMVRLSYCSLNLAETEVSTAVLLIECETYLNFQWYVFLQVGLSVPRIFMSSPSVTQEINRVLKPGGVLEVCHMGCFNILRFKLWPVRSSTKIFFSPVAILLTQNPIRMRLQCNTVALNQSLSPPRAHGLTHMPCVLRIPVLSMPKTFGRPLRSVLCILITRMTGIAPRSTCHLCSMQLTLSITRNWPKLGRTCSLHGGYHRVSPRCCRFIYQPFSKTSKPYLRSKFSSVLIRRSTPPILKHPSK
jgi:SAM-dependent methyltransferase